jgi:hypothetical protein
MIIGHPMVVVLKNLRSAGKCHSNWLFKPMAFLISVATIAARIMIVCLRK